MKAAIRPCLFALLLTSFGVTPILADPVAVDAKTVVTAPNWVVGSSWYYSDGYAFKVTAATPQATTFDRLDAPGQWFSRQGFLRKDLTSGTATRTSIFRTIPDQAGMNLQAGKPLTFQREYLENGALMVHATSWSVEGRETITVPAGTFDCFVIVWRSRSLRSDWTGFERWWYSPKAQNYVRMEYKYGADEEGSRVLMRYQIGDPIGNPAPAAITDAAAKIEPVTISPPVALPADLPVMAANTDTVTASPPPPADTVAETAPVAAANPDPMPDPAPKPDADAPKAPAKPAPAATKVAAKAAAKTKSAEAAKPNGPWHAQIMASQQESAARKGLDKVLRSHAAILKDVPSGVAAAKISGKGMFYRAWLGQFASAAEARSLCDRLKAGGVACTISQAHSDDTRISLSKL